MYATPRPAISSAVLLQLFVINTGQAQNAVCSPAMAPAQCAEAQITAIGKTFGEYKAQITSLEDRLSSANSQIEKLSEKTAKLEALTISIDKDTRPFRPGGQSCFFVRQGDHVAGWQYKGFFGLIQYRPYAPGNSDGFARGGAFTSDWYWEHEDIYCAK